MWHVGCFLMPNFKYVSASVFELNICESEMPLTIALFGDQNSIRYTLWLQTEVERAGRSGGKDENLTEGHSGTVLGVY